MPIARRKMFFWIEIAAIVFVVILPIMVITGTDSASQVELNNNVSSAYFIGTGKFGRDKFKVFVGLDSERSATLFVQHENGDIKSSRPSLYSLVTAYLIAVLFVSIQLVGRWHNLRIRSDVEDLGSE